MMLLRRPSTYTACPIRVVGGGAEKQKTRNKCDLATARLATGDKTTVSRFLFCLLCARLASRRVSQICDERHFTTEISMRSSKDSILALQMTKVSPVEPCLCKIKFLWMFWPSHRLCVASDWNVYGALRARLRNIWPWVHGNRDSRKGSPALNTGSDT